MGDMPLGPYDHVRAKRELIHRLCWVGAGVVILCVFVGGLVTAIVATGRNDAQAGRVYSAQKAAWAIRRYLDSPEAVQKTILADAKPLIESDPQGRSHMNYDEERVRLADDLLRLLEPPLPPLPPKPPVYLHDGHRPPP